jgi:DNA-binding beta-propeller fold protein YncE
VKADMRRATVALALASAVLVLAACGNGGSAPVSRAVVKLKVGPERILPGPKDLIAAGEPQPDGKVWALAGSPSTGLFEISSASGQMMGSVSVSNAARSVAVSSAGTIAVALGTAGSGALELLDGRTVKVVRVVALPAPARQVTAGRDGTTFYVLTRWATAASVTIVNSLDGKISASIPVPVDTVSIASDAHQTTLYALQENGLVDEIGISGGKVISQFSVGDDGESMALSPDGSTLYVLKGTPDVSNIAVVDLSTESVRRVLPSPSHCLELLVSASGSQLYEVVGAPGYGNIQVFAA